jgi:chain length determinant protein tyrosine kinase EpsG
MAKFRDSVADAATIVEQAAKTLPTPPVQEEAAADRSIGNILAELRNLTADQVESILRHQREAGVRFGEAAVALGFASKDDVLFALAQQFNYPYAPDEKTKLGAELVVLNEPFSPRAEHFRALRSQIAMRLHAEGEPRRALAVISADSGDGKTYCAANLAATLAQLGGRTLVVDADMRNPRLHEVFKLENRSGLSGILSGRADSHVIQQVKGVSSLFVLPVGTTPPNPVELVERPAFGLLMRELAAKFDHVVVDTPAAALGADCAVIAARCGAALVLARKHASRIGRLHELVASFDGTPVKLAGVVLNEF